MSEDFHPSPHLIAPKQHEFDVAENVYPKRTIKTDFSYMTEFFRSAFLIDDQDYDAEKLLKIPKEKTGYLKNLKQLIPDLPDIPEDELRILDLGCGEALFFRKYLELCQNHSSSEETWQQFRQKSFPKDISYVGVDQSMPPDYRDALKGESSKYECLDCDFWSFNIADTKHIGHLEKIVVSDPFHVVIMSNVLHEIPMNNWPDLMATIPNLLKENGIFILLDLCNPMNLEGHDRMFGRFQKSQSFWEADATYLLCPNAYEMIEKIGMTVLKHSEEMIANEPYWYIKARKTNELSKDDVKKEIDSYLSQFINDCKQAWKENSKKIREDTRKLIEQAKKDVECNFAGTRYLCLCASNMRLREY